MVVGRGGCGSRVEGLWAECRMSRVVGRGVEGIEGVMKVTRNTRLIMSSVGRNYLINQLIMPSDLKYLANQVMWSEIPS